MPRRALGALAALALFSGALGIVSVAALAAPPAFLWQSAETGSGAGQSILPRGIAAVPDSAANKGHLYLADSGATNNRIEEYTPWGEFVKAWGWGVLNGAPELQTCTALTGCLGAHRGSGSGEFSGVQGLAADAAGNVFAIDRNNNRVQKFDSSANLLLIFGGDVVSSGPGNSGADEQQTLTVKATGGKFSLTATTATGAGLISAGSNQVTGVSNTLGAFHVGDAISGTGIPANTTIAAVGAGTLTLSANATSSGAPELSAKENTGATGVGTTTDGSNEITGLTTRSGAFAVGERISISGSTVAAGTTIAALGAGTLTLSNPVTAGGGAGKTLTAADIDFDAPAGEGEGAGSVEAALSALPGIGAGGVEVSGGPGDATGTAPYAIAFSGGLLQGNDVEQLGSSTVNLEGTKAATLATTAPGGGPEVCKPATDVCKQGNTGTAKGQFGSWPVSSFIATGPAGKVYVGDNNRIQRFNGSTGAVEPAGELPLPGGGETEAVAVDGAGHVYEVSKNVSSTVREYKSAEEGSGLVDQIEVPAPKALAVDPSGTLYVVSGASSPLIRKFDSAGAELESWGQEEPPAPKPSASTGIAVNFCAGSDLPGNVYLTNTSPAFLRAYGTGPVGCEDPPLKAPRIRAQYAVSAGTDSASVRAQITPEFFPDTTYYVEYGTGSCAAGECDRKAPLEPALLGGGRTNALLTTSGVFLGGLVPETTYRYRFVAESSGGGPEYGLRPPGKEEEEGAASFTEGLEATFTTPPLSLPPKADCPNQVFRTGPSAFLPECRAFEMVSPVDKNGGGIETFTTNSSAQLKAAHDQGAASGDGVTYSAKQAFGDAVGSPYSSQYVSSRNPASGWLTHSVNAPRKGFPGGIEHTALDDEFKAFSEDLVEAWLIHQAEPALAPCAPIESSVLYRRDNTDDSYEVLHCEPNVPFAGAAIELQGISADGCRAVFRSRGKLTADAEEGGTTSSPFQLYESSCEAPPRPEGPVRLVSVRPNGVNCKTESSAGSGVGGPTDGRSNSVWHAFSADGHRLYWSCGNTLYLRTDPDLTLEGEEETVQVAGPELSIAPRFETASPDGARALLIAPLGSGGYQLQAYDAVTETTTPIASEVEDATGRRLDLLGASEDATRAYFVSREDLTPGKPNSEGDEAIEGEPNLYLHEEGAGFDFVGTLAADDLKEESMVPSPVHQLPARRAARVSPDGLHAAFVSTAPLTGFDNTDANNGKADAEVFVYDATADGGEGKLMCVSCNFTGVRPSGRNIGLDEGAVEDTKLWAAAHIPGWETQLYQGRPLSEDGRRLFFNSFEALVDRDSNNRQDVYEWQQVDGTGKAGEEECEQIGAELFNEEAGGCISLISSGRDPVDSELVDADEDGSDVFIRTAESLVGQDPGLVDIYDARIGGGFPPPAGPVEPCEGEACQSPPPPPAFTTPSSSAYQGPPNPRQAKSKPRRCPKGKRRVRRKGKSRCVPRRKAREDKRRAQAKRGRAGR